MNEILEVLPYRPPFLLVDQICEYQSGYWVKGYKNLSWSEWFFDQKSEKPAMPFMLVVESIAQLSVCLDDPQNGLGFLASFKGVRFENHAYPGDRLDLFFEIIKKKRTFMIGYGEARVEGKSIVQVEEMSIYLSANAG
ncbi:3-hydroxyacyl-ACP dehydratase FabZ family protein [Desmospora activa]|uniref:3-hydroxyacyl-[acyl-carrier-protein] dehydratase n=1 Tax=Desmospora activa DSM 45169 TaxID=1121389 RepID=A0A2T4ZAD7_9BACL|nr:3-hydroxyacyl-ACP dehydratase FabZ family protein [Desmospora activa]PTM58825.1 3-hydroxyacyl-[acyl-carrier-protein] dehydratase [Desmospora activa DSM 45169]